MPIVRYSSEPNFGDDLNDLIWPALLPAEVVRDPDHLIFGIGTILNQDRADEFGTVGRRVDVLGAGVGYGPLPRDHDSYRYLAVRGPLSAQRVGRPDSAVTDGAILLAALPEPWRRTSSAGAGQRVAFVPHHHTLRSGAWEEISEEAGLVFVDPRWDAIRVLSTIASADLVVCEAMHGAIVADTFRIPWVAVTISHRILPLKWNDWTSSMGLSYDPVRLPVSSAWELVERRLRRSSEPQATEHMDTPQPGRLLRPTQNIAPTVRRLTDRVRGPFREAAVKGLVDAQSRRPSLSSDAVFAQRVEMMLGAVGRVAV